MRNCGYKNILQTLFHRNYANHKRFKLMVILIIEM